MYRSKTKIKLVAKSRKTRNKQLFIALNKYFHKLLN